MSRIKFHNLCVKCSVAWASILVFFGAMGLDGEHSVASFFGIALGSAWILSFIIANQERFE